MTLSEDSAAPVLSMEKYSEMNAKRLQYAERIKQPYHSLLASMLNRDPKGYCHFDIITNAVRSHLIIHQRTFQYPLLLLPIRSIILASTSSNIIKDCCSFHFKIFADFLICCLRIISKIRNNSSFYGFL